MAGECRPTWMTGLVLALLALHFAARWQQSRALPLADRHFYPRNYSLALSWIAGEGFHDFPVGDTPGTNAVDSFLKLERPGLTRDELQRAFREPCPESADPSFRFWELLATTRLLDIWSAALLWKCFGISWQVLFTFYALVSTACCGMVFMIARRLSGSIGAGLAAGLLFLASPLESYVSAWAIRDASPGWFAIASCWLLVCFIGRYEGRWPNRIGYLALGVVSTLGTGWRLDALLWLPYFGLAMLALLVIRRVPLRQVAAAAGLLALGSMATHIGIAALRPSVVMPAGIGFHMAYYADYTRSNLAGLENSFQVNRCDAQTLFTARLVADQRAGGHGAPVEYVTPRYSQVCREAYLEQVRYHAYDWVRVFPRFFWQCLNGLSTADSFFGAPRSALDSYRFAAMRPIYHWLLDPLTSCLPWLTITGVLAATFSRRERWTAIAVAIFPLYYTPVLWLVLPESKHLMPLVLPLTVFGGIGLATVVRIVRPANWRSVSRRQWKTAAGAWGGVVGVAALIWIVALVVARPLAERERRGYIDSILDLARHGSDAGELLRGDSVFTLSIAPGEQTGWQGYLLAIKAGDEPGELICCHSRCPRDWLWATYFGTRHQLQPGKRQFFFVSALQGGQYGDPRPYSLTVEVEPGTQVEACTRIDLQDWKKLPVSMVFEREDHLPGSSAAPADNSTFSQAVPAALPSTLLDPVARQRALLAMPWQPVARLPSDAQPADSLIGRDRQTGAWWLAVNFGETCLGHTLPELDPTEFGPDTQVGDFNGDGADDLVSWNRRTGTVTVAIFHGFQYHCRTWAHLLTENKDELQVADLNGDTLDDIAVFDRASGAAQAGISRGNRFGIETLAKPPTEPRSHHDNFNGQELDGRPVPQPPEPLTELTVGDFDGDGRRDIAGTVAASGIIRIAFAEGSTFRWRSCGGWLTTSGIEQVKAIRFWPANRDSNGKSSPR